MRNLCKIAILGALLLCQETFGQGPFIKDDTDEITQVETDSFYNPEKNYAEFSGRVTDRNDDATIFKISTENSNVKLFRAGDQVKFKVARIEERLCEGYIRSVEENFFVIYVGDIYPCWPKEEFFRRGTILRFNAPILEQRVKAASKYRQVLLNRRKSFLKQLNQINHFIWSYDQKKVLVAGEYDKKIVELQKQKQKALENLQLKRKDQIHLQKELIKRLDILDKDLKHYRVEKDELFVDRWHLDQDLGLPIGKRPQEKVIIKPE